MIDRDHAIMQGFARLGLRTQRLGRIVHPLMEIIMANIDDLKAEIDRLGTAVRADQEGDAAIVASLNSTIDDLRSQLASDQPVDTQSLIDSLEGIRNSLTPADSGTTASTTAPTTGEPATPPADGGAPTG